MPDMSEFHETEEGMEDRCDAQRDSEKLDDPHPDCPGPQNAWERFQRFLGVPFFNPRRHAPQMKFFGKWPCPFWEVPAYWVLFLISLGAAVMAWHDYPVPFIK